MCFALLDVEIGVILNAGRPCRAERGRQDVCRNCLELGMIGFNSPPALYPPLRQLKPIAIAEPFWKLEPRLDMDAF